MLKYWAPLCQLGTWEGKNQVFSYPSSLQEELLQQLEQHERMCFYNKLNTIQNLFCSRKPKWLFPHSRSKHADGSLNHHLKKLTFLGCCFKALPRLQTICKSCSLLSSLRTTGPSLLKLCQELTQEPRKCNRNLHREVTQTPVTHRALQRVPGRQTVMMESRHIILFPPGQGISASLVQEALGNITKVSAQNGSLGEQATFTRK